MPISSPGFAEGVQKMADAWEKLSVYNGRVVWEAGVPKIIVDGLPGADRLLRPWQCRWFAAEETLAVYVPSKESWVHNGERVDTLAPGEWPQEDEEAEENGLPNGWYPVATAETLAELDGEIVLAVLLRDNISGVLRVWARLESDDPEDWPEEWPEEWPGNYIIATDLPVAVVRGGRTHQMRAGAIYTSDAVEMFEAVTESGDYLMCARVTGLDEDQQPIPVDPGEEEETLFKVWKPWLLRKTPFDGKTRDGIEYTYDVHEVGKRVAENEEEEEETQRVTPSYSLCNTEEGNEHAGELIHAIASPGGWQDINTAGRCWAAVFEAE